MDLAEQAYLARLKGDSASSKELIKQAYIKEKEVALEFENKTEMEPTRSVLLRSAASLAYECGQAREAERLIAMALSGNPPDEIAEELRELLYKIYQNIEKEDESTHSRKRGIKVKLVLTSNKDLDRIKTAIDGLKGKRLKGPRTSQPVQNKFNFQSSGQQGSPLFDRSDNKSGDNPSDHSGVYDGILRQKKSK